ncbi:MAG: 16S rRNA (guanine(527)-N(7))-methyltransferase RsmG [Bacteroidales bacterium]|nr:16S rRNA (guanine(527)-N(7))-methyltransferase RsmG [Bacteroidales bacterium]
MEIVEKYFPHLTSAQRARFNTLTQLYGEWNQRINVVSRKDMDDFDMHHVLHSLGIAKVVSFLPDAQVLDLGTGGGFPGIPLAILFPNTHFTLVDSIGKKIKVVDAVVQQLELRNVTTRNCRAEQTEGQFDFVVSRAVASMESLDQWSRSKIAPVSRHSLPNGLLCLKGGDLVAELEPYADRITRYNLSDHFSEDFFTTKQVVYLSPKQMLASTIRRTAASGANM